MILDSDYQTLTVQTQDGQILIRNIDEYNLLKYGDFNGNRIIKEFQDGVKVQETFNEGIFNVFVNDETIQIRDKLEIAKRLKYAIENNDTEPIRELLIKNLENEIKSDILQKWLMPFWERVKFKDSEIIIDDLFKVNKDATAYYNNGSKRLENDWSFLCIVAGDKGNMNRVVKHALGEVKIDFKTMEIYNKVLFLLFPNINDSVFYNQLPEDLKQKVKENLLKIVY